MPKGWDSRDCRRQQRRLVRLGYARKGLESLRLLPTRAHFAIEWIGLTTRAKAKAAIETGKLRWDEKQKHVVYKGKRVRNLGRKSWLELQEWAADDWLKAGNGAVRSP